MPEAPRVTNVIEHEVRIAARPETVFAYFTDPARMVQWMGVEATVDPRPGGVCRIVFPPSQAVVEFLGVALGSPENRLAQRVERGRGWAMLGEFVEVDPPRRIVLSWGWEQKLLEVPPQSTAVEVSLTQDGIETVVRLTHRRLPDVALAFHRVGWEHYLDRLAIAAAGADPGPDATPVPDLGTATQALSDLVRHVN
jgi:uncharacterized protein YndB with AHSA1/START domain